MVHAYQIQLQVRGAVMVSSPLLNVESKTIWPALTIISPE
jgi:hypothetical protein